MVFQNITSNYGCMRVNIFCIFQIDFVVSSFGLSDIDDGFFISSTPTWKVEMNI